MISILSSLDLPRFKFPVARYCYVSGMARSRISKRVLRPRFQIELLSAHLSAIPFLPEYDRFGTESSVRAARRRDATGEAVASR